MSEAPEGIPPMVHAVAEALRADCLRTFGATWSYDVSWAFARAAIEAMREPTEAMRHAVWYDQYITCGGSPKEADMLARKRVKDPTQREQDLSSFGALIDAALAEPTAPR